MVLPDQAVNKGGIACQDDGAARTALTTKEECREAWRYLQPYAEGVQADARRLARLQGGLT